MTAPILRDESPALSGGPLVAAAEAEERFATDDYGAHLASVGAQLEPQLPRDLGSLVLIPTVGFGVQSHRVLPGTIRQLAAQRTSGPPTVVMLVNRPENRASDGTEEIARREIALHGPAGPRFAVASVVVEGRPRVGSLRQLLHDAVALCAGGIPPSTPVIIADDDIVHAPPGALESLACGLRTTPGCNAVVGPVLFDDDEMPSVLLPDFFVSDVLRALLAARWVARLSAPSGSSLCARRSADQWRRYAEAIALSGNMAVQSGALLATGGFPPLNEITGVAQRMWPGPAGCMTVPYTAGRPAGVAGIWDFDGGGPDVVDSLLDSAVRVSSRRALRAFARSRVPSIAQWLACRFHASRVDPARQAPPRFPDVATIDRLGCGAVEQLVESAASLIAITLGFFPPDAEPARDALRAIGLDERRCTAEPAEREGAPWRVRIHDPSVMLERVVAAQRRLVRGV